MLFLVSQRNPVTFIKYLLPKDAVISIKIYDIFGEQVMTVLDHQFREAGQHSFEIDSPSLPRGIYVYELQDEQDSSVRRLVMMSGHRNGNKPESLKIESPKL